MFADFFTFSSSRSSRPPHFSRSRLLRAFRVMEEAPPAVPPPTATEESDHVMSDVETPAFRRLDRHGRWKEVQRLVEAK